MNEMVLCRDTEGSPVRLSRGRARGWARRVVAAPFRRGIRRFWRDRRGSTGVMAIIMLPAILLVFLGGMKIWETMMIRTSLNTGVALATRYLSLYPPKDANETIWSDIAEKFVYAELKNNNFVDQTFLNGRGVPVSVTLIDGGNFCMDKFQVSATYPLNVEMRLGRYAMPNLQWAQLLETQLGEVVCD